MLNVGKHTSPMDSMGNPETHLNQPRIHDGFHAAEHLRLVNELSSYRYIPLVYRSDPPLTRHDIHEIN